MSSYGNTNHSNFPKPRVIIDRIALDKIRYLVEKDSQELSGMGITRVVGDTIYVDDVQMLEQKNGAAHTDIDATAVSKLMYEWRERTGEVNFWWHSHANMGVFWSSTDIDTIKQLGKQGMCVAAVFNKKGEIRTAVACKMQVPFSDKEQIVIFDELQLQFQSNTPDEIKRQWDAEHEANVKKFVPQVWRGGSHTTNGTSHFGGGSDDRMFFPCVTKFPDHWDTQEQARNFDINWQGDCFLDYRQGDTHGLYRKSTLQRRAEREWLATKKEILGIEDKTKTTNHGPGSARRLPPPLPSVTPAISARHTVREQKRGVKMVFAQSRDEITEYDPLLDMFTLYNGSKIDAEYYMSKDGQDFRQKTVDLHGAKDLAPDEKAALQQMEQQLEQENIELAREMAAYERDIAIRTGAADIPDGDDEDEDENTTSEAEWQNPGRTQ